MTTYLKNAFIVFTASACILIIEIVAARVLAPVIGVSLYTWTSIIGIILAGISVGNYLGGSIADKYTSNKLLGYILLAAGVSSLLILPLLHIASALFISLPLIPRIISFTITLFFLPSLILGMITPVVIKSQLHDLSNAGDTVGKIYAISTIGSLLGTFLTGYWLIQWMGVKAILLVVAGILLAMGLLLGNLFQKNA